MEALHGVSLSRWHSTRLDSNKRMVDREEMSARGQIGGKTGGHVQGIRNVESGHIWTITTPESLHNAGLYGSHSRWHTARQISKPRICKLCRLEEQLTAQEQDN